MPYRRFPPDVGNFYHVFNRSVGKQTIFSNFSDYKRALETLQFYSFSNPPMRFSHYKKLSDEAKKILLIRLEGVGEKQVEIIAFCLMPNHIHFSFKEIKRDGIQNFMRKVQNSYAKYFNTKYKRTGSLFQSMFKSERILDDKSLTYVIQYIHWNPLNAGIIKKPEDLETYPWSSLPDYLQKRELPFLKKDYIIRMFPTQKGFRTFTFGSESTQQSYTPGV